MNTLATHSEKLGKLVKQGLIRELYRQHITQVQFEQLMKLQRA